MPKITAINSTKFSKASTVPNDTRSASPFLLLVRDGSVYMNATIRSAPGYTAAETRNAALNPTAAASTPPITGPTAGPIRCAVWTVPIARAICSAGADIAAIETVSGP